MQSFQFQIWYLLSKQVPSSYLFAIQFGDHCPKTHIAGFDTGQAQEGGRWGQRAGPCRLRPPLTCLRSTEHKTANTQIFNSPFTCNG